MIFTGETMVLSGKAIFCPLFLTKFKIKTLPRFFRNFPKPPNYLKFASDVNIFNTNERFSRKRVFSEKRQCYVSFIFPSTSHQILEKSSERFLRYAVTDGQTDGQTNKPEFIDPPVFNWGPITLFLNYT